jgi:hypothetical protein
MSFFNPARICAKIVLRKLLKNFFMYKRLLLCTSVALAGCNSTPSSGDVEDFLETKFSSCKNIKIVDVKKTNGYEKDGYYQVEFSYRIKYDEAKDLLRAYLEAKENSAQFVKDEKIFDQQKAELLKEIDRLEAEFKKSTPSPYGEMRSIIAGSAEDKALTAASDEWQRKRSEYTQQKTNELKELEEARQQKRNQSRSNGVLGNEGNKIYDFNLLGCARDAYKFAPVDFPEKDEEAERTGYKSYMFKAHESKMRGTLAMRKTENGWQSLSQN